MEEPFFTDIFVDSIRDSRDSGSDNDPVYKILSRSGVDVTKIDKIYADTILRRIIYNRFNSSCVQPNSLIYAANDSIKVGFDRRAKVDIHFIGVRTLLMIDFDDANKWGLTRYEFVQLLHSMSKDGYTFALHCSDRGMHAFCVSHHLNIYNSEVYKLMRCGASDIFYILFTLSQGWRIRVAPKASRLDDKVAWPVVDLKRELKITDAEIKIPGRVDESCQTWVIGEAPVLPEHGITLQVIIDLCRMFVELYTEQKVTPEWFDSLTTNRELLQNITRRVHRILDEKKVVIDKPTSYPNGYLLLEDHRPKEREVQLPTHRSTELPPDVKPVTLELTEGTISMADIIARLNC